MSTNQKVLVAITVTLVVITLVSLFVFFSPPFSNTVKVNLAFVIQGEILLGASVVATAGSRDRELPFKAGVPFLWLVYLLAALVISSISSLGLPTPMLALMHVVCLFLALIAQALFWMAGRHIAAQEQLDAQRIEERRDWE